MTSSQSERTPVYVPAPLRKRSHVASWLWQHTDRFRDELGFRTVYPYELALRLARWLP